jgi:hypothetical protein
MEGRQHAVFSPLLLIVGLGREVPIPFIGWQ